MPLLRLIAENVGPFDKLDIDFSDGHGKPQVGPQILAGVNGSGKSTVLRAIAWAQWWGLAGFPEKEWVHFLRGPESRVLVQVLFGGEIYINAGTRDTTSGWEERLEAWVRSRQVGGKIGLVHTLGASRGEPLARRPNVLNQGPLIAAYAPARTLSYVHSLQNTEIVTGPTIGCFGFESTVQNMAIQRWVVDLFSRKALARERGQQFDSYDQTLTRLQEALKLVCDDSDIQLDVELGPILEPRLNFHGKKLNFSQLSDGIRTTIGWLADFMMRQDQLESTDGAKAATDGILLLDEIDIYLHPRLQRTLLPAIRKALPDVQIIATSHSPFVISSCADACIHVLTLDEQGVAHACPPQKAPFGASVTATLKDIFGVESRFDVQTEANLKTWDTLKREEAVGKLTPAKQKQLTALTKKLSERSEELRLIVRPPAPMAANVLSSLTGHRAQKRRAKLG
jgi:hypothetical protein